MGGWGVKFFCLKFNQIWCVSYSHEWHMHRHNFFGPGPLGPWGGVKNKISEHGHVAYQIKGDGQYTKGGLDLAIFRVLGVRQNSHINK